MVHTHYSGRFERQEDGSVIRLGTSPQPWLTKPPSYQSDDATFLGIAKEVVNYSGHIGYELCSPVLIGHHHAGQEYALEQAELACAYMRQILNSI